MPICGLFYSSNEDDTIDGMTRRVAALETAVSIAESRLNEESDVLTYRVIGATYGHARALCPSSPDQTGLLRRYFEISKRILPLGICRAVVVLSRDGVVSISPSLLTYYNDENIAAASTTCEYADHYSTLCSASTVHVLCVFLYLQSLSTLSSVVLAFTRSFSFFPIAVSSSPCLSKTMGFVLLCTHLSRKYCFNPWNHTSALMDHGTWATVLENFLL